MQKNIIETTLIYFGKVTYESYSYKYAKSVFYWFHFTLNDTDFKCFHSFFSFVCMRLYQYDGTLTHPFPGFVRFYHNSLK